MAKQSIPECIVESELWRRFFDEASRLQKESAGNRDQKRLMALWGQITHLSDSDTAVSHSMSWIREGQRRGWDADRIADTILWLRRWTQGSINLYL